ncbi:hypothetical protein [Chitinophaga qingshengii]|uniref:Uncharacterized protein n=1 Tax=Chitinophaga qingshengii TaxID=1569794 RepID=A0ABR7TGF6_9BACT|nr:hypothetical protein [Chitinophaga qingshengii]MBC9929537.1 hypothetical protein [Chitinophaga qingshengii]
MVLFEPMYLRFIVLSLLPGLLWGCGVSMEKSIFLKHSNDSLNINYLLEKGQRPIGMKIRQGRVLVISTTAKNDHPTLTLIDIPQKQTIASLEISKLRYYEILTDFNESRLIYCSVYHPHDLFFYDFNKKVQTSYSFSPDRSLNAGDIISKNNQLYYLKGTYGTSRLDFKTNTVQFYQDNASVVNPLSGNISFPIDSGLTLIAGNGFPSDSIQLVAVDTFGKERWSYKTTYKQSSSTPLDMINEGNSFIIKTGNNLLKLDKKDGKKIGGQQFTADINKVIRCHHALIVYSVDYHLKEDADRRKVTVKSIDDNHLQVNWSADFDVVGEPQLGVVDNYLFLVDRDSVWKMDAKSRSVVDRFAAGKSYISMLTDIDTGKNYLVLNGEVLIW